MTATTLTRIEEKPVQMSYLHALLAWESVLFAFICTLDLCTTLYWVHLGVAGEANPLLSPYLKQGVVPFVITKLVSYVPMLLVAAWYRQRNPKFIATALRLAIVAYVTIYCFGVGGQFLQ